MSVLAYLIYGNNATYELEFLLSALSARIRLRGDPAADGVRIVLLTDRPRFGDAFPFEERVLAPGALEAWGRTPGRAYNHRIKVHAMLEAMSLHDGPAALVDTDTWFLDSPLRLFERIAPDTTVMHEREVPHVQDDPDCDDLSAYLRGGRVVEGIPMSNLTPMYNSGVVGVLPTHRPLVEKTLAVLDGLYDAAPVFNVEQFAFGAVLGHATGLAVCDDVVRHYWGHARGFVHVQAERHLGPRDAKTFREREAQALPFLGEPAKAWQDQLAARARGALGRWSQDYRFAYLAACSAHREAPRDRAFANAWAAVALEDLRRLEREASPQRMRADFARWFAQPSARLAWLDRELHARWQAFLAR